MKSKGDWRKTKIFLEAIKDCEYLRDWDKYGQTGVEALSAATPVDTGMTANSWKYDIEELPGKIRIVWSNTNIRDNVNIAVILQYGHGTGTGGYVEGRDYINPAMQSVFDEIANRAWEELSKL